MNDYWEPSTSIDNFVPLQKIGEGTFSSVYKVRRKVDGCVYALKKIKITTLKSKQKKNSLNQVRILASLHSDYIVCYKQAFFDDKLNLLCIVMDWASNRYLNLDEGDLKKKVKTYKDHFESIPEPQIWKAISHIVSGLNVLHSNSILHRDLKSANIFIKDGVYLIGDLNVSKIQNADSILAYTQTGTPYYSAPEIWKDEPYDSKSDIWSVGCIIYEMCSLKPPFKGKNMEELYKSVVKGLYPDIPEIYSSELRKMISLLLAKNPRKRPSTAQLLSSHMLNRKGQLAIGEGRGVLRKNTEILKTIYLPSNLKLLKKELPGAAYEDSIQKLHFPKKQSQVHLTKKKISSKALKSVFIDYSQQPEKVSLVIDPKNYMRSERKLKHPGPRINRKLIESLQRISLGKHEHQSQVQDQPESKFPAINRLLSLKLISKGEQIQSRRVTQNEDIMIAERQFLQHEKNNKSLDYLSRIQEKIDQKKKSIQKKNFPTSLHEKSVPRGRYYYQCISGRKNRIPQEKQFIKQCQQIDGNISYQVSQQTGDIMETAKKKFSVDRKKNISQISSTPCITVLPTAPKINRRSNDCSGLKNEFKDLNLLNDLRKAHK